MATLSRPVEGAGLALFRGVFGLVMAAAALRFALKGWIDALLVDPAFHFTWAGLDFVRPWPQPWMNVHFAVMGAAALGVAAGWRTRWCAAVFGLLFTWVELIDKATYLNHYYLVSLLAALLVVVPAGEAWSLDARRRGSWRGRPVAAGWLYLLRAQVGLVYGFAGLAKLNGDWLLRAEPLQLWLQRFADLPAAGPLLTLPATAYAMAWAGLLFDTTAGIGLAWRRTRPFYGAAAVVFHLTIWLLFPVGMFSFIMLTAITVFREAKPVEALEAARAPRLGLQRAALGFAAAWLVVQLVVPMRGLLYPGELHWTEQGFRFGWRVMLIEKAGWVEYRVVSGSPPVVQRIAPRAELTPLQVKAMSTQPDMILDYAHHLAERARQERGVEQVSVYADAFANLNGGPSQRLVDPAVDLAAQPRGLTAAPWIVPRRDPPER
jgi:vitamin K-dependent gamma-carboxylase